MILYFWLILSWATGAVQSLPILRGAFLAFNDPNELLKLTRCRLVEVVDLLATLQLAHRGTSVLLLAAELKPDHLHNIFAVAEHLILFRSLLVPLTDHTLSKGAVVGGSPIKIEGLKLSSTGNQTHSCARTEANLLRRRVRRRISHRLVTNTALALAPVSP